MEVGRRSVGELPKDSPRGRERRTLPGRASPKPRGRKGVRLNVDHNWLRVGLARDVEPGDRTAVDVELPAIDRPGSYEVEFDIVLEGVTWFAEHGSPTTSLRLTVE